MLILESFLQRLLGRKLRRYSHWHECCGRLQSLQKRRRTAPSSKTSRKSLSEAPPLSRLRKRNCLSGLGVFFFASLRPANS